MLCDEVRCGVGSTEWCGVVWCGVVWCGVVWCGVERCDEVRCGAVRGGVVWVARSGDVSQAPTPRGYLREHSQAGQSRRRGIVLVLHDEVAQVFELRQGAQRHITRHQVLQQQQQEQQGGQGRSTCMAGGSGQEHVHGRGVTSKRLRTLKP